MSVIFKPYFESENIISNEICELRIFFYTETCRSIYRNSTPKGEQGSFSNCGLKITYIVWEWTSSLSGSVNRRINREWKRFSLSNMQRKKGSRRIEMIIKTVNEFKLTVVHFARPNPMQICACTWIYRWTKKLWKIRTGPPGLRAAGPLGLGPRACF